MQQQAERNAIFLPPPPCHQKFFPSRHRRLINVLKQKNNRLNYVVCFLLGDSPASDLYMPTFRNTLSVPSSKAGVKTSHLPLKMEQIECSETSAYINQTPGNHPKENKQHSEHGESLKSRTPFSCIYVISFLHLWSDSLETSRYFYIQ